MKIQLDTSAKTIKVENDIKIKDLIKTLKKLLPDDWEDFELQTNVTINNWNTPIVVGGGWSRPLFPWYNETICKSESDNKQLCDYSLKAGTYNIEC